MPNDDRDSPERTEWEDSGFAMHGDSGGLCDGSFGDRINSIVREKQSLPDLEKIRNSEQSDVPNGHWETFAQAATGTSSDGIRRGSLVPVGETVTLEELINPALTVLKEVMGVELDDSDPNFARILSTKKDAAVSVVNAALKADENRFRQRKSNVLEELITRINKIKPITIEAIP
jgi:hypothetical protein